MNVEVRGIVYGERSDALRGATAQAVHCYCYEMNWGDRFLIIHAPYAPNSGKKAVKFCPFCGKGADS